MQEKESLKIKKRTNSSRKKKKRGKGKKLFFTLVFVFFFLSSTMDSPDGSPVASQPKGNASQPSELNRQAQELRGALYVAGKALSSVPTMVEAFSEAPYSVDRSQLIVTPAQVPRMMKYGIIEGAQDPDPLSNVPRLGPAPWRDQIPRRPALPAATRVWLPQEFFVQDSRGASARTSLGYNYFHGNRVYNGLFIATQAPVVKTKKVNGVNFVYDTRADFWLAVRTNNVRCIVMLASWSEDPHVTPYLPIAHKDLTEVYYAFWGGMPPPENEMNKPEGPPGWLIRVAVTVTAVEDRAARAITLRDVSLTFSVRNPSDGTVVTDTNVHHVRHIHYYSWPDGGVPSRVDDMLGLISVGAPWLLDHQSHTPTMVHCLAGHGRTGTLLTTLAAFRDTVASPSEDTKLSERLLLAFYLLRNERYFLVQNSIQLIYSFACYVLLLSAAQGGTNVPLISNVRSISAKQAERLRSSVPLTCVHCLKEVGTVAELTRLESAEDQTWINFCSKQCAARFARHQWPAATLRQLTELPRSSAP